MCSKLLIATSPCNQRSYRASHRFSSPCVVRSTKRNPEGQTSRCLHARFLEECTQNGGQNMNATATKPDKYARYGQATKLEARSFSMECIQDDGQAPHRKMDSCDNQIAMPPYCTICMRLKSTAANLYRSCQASASRMVPRMNLAHAAPP